MRALLTRITKVASLGLAALALASCGGGDGGDGGYGTRPLIDVKITATPSTLPVNTLGYSAQIGSPYTNLITVTVTQDDRAYAAPAVSIDLLGPQGSGALYYIDGNSEHETCTTNDAGVEECVPSAYRRVTFDNTTGYVTAHFHAWSEPGTVQVVASVADPNTGQSVTATADITVGSTANTGVPGVVSFSTVPELYVQGQNRADTATLVMAVLDDGGFKISAPSGNNNLQVELLDGRPNGGEYLAAKGVSGNQTGTQIKTYSSSGVAEAVLHAGSLPGTVRIKATADRSDNNVDNGIQSPISSTITATIGSGEITSLNFTGAYAGAVEAYANSLVSGPGDSINSATGVYTRTLSIVAADEFGNPPPSNTPITLRLVDSPSVGYPDNGRGAFVVAGNDGNPQEGGAVFTTKTTIPTTTGCPATNSILVVDGLRPYQSGSRIVSGFNPPMTLSVNNAFYDWQVDTGFSVPYVVGCTPHYGNVDTVAYTDAKGVASFAMRYPTTQLGRNFILTAEAAGSKVGAVMRHWYLGLTQNATLSLIGGSANTSNTITLTGQSCSGTGSQTACVYSGSSTEKFQLLDGSSQPLQSELLAVEINPDSTVMDSIQTAMTEAIANIAALEVEKVAAEKAQAAETAACNGDQVCIDAITAAIDAIQAQIDAEQARLDKAQALWAVISNPEDYVTISPNPLRTGAGGLAQFTVTANSIPSGIAFDLVFATVGASSSEPDNPLLSGSVVISLVAPGDLGLGSTVTP